MLKDVESLSALQGHSSEDRGRFGEAMAVKRAGVVPDDGMRTLVWQGGYRRDRGRLDFTKKASLSEIYSVIAMWVTY